MVQQSIDSSEELFHYALRSILMMENHSLEALEELSAVAQDSRVKKLFTHHMDETNEQIDNLTQVFTLLDAEATTAPSPATTGIKNQAASLLERTDKQLHDQVALMSAMGNEHFEIASYSSLILAADSLGLSDASRLLQANLDQEKHTSKELQSCLRDMLA